MDENTAKKIIEKARSLLNTPYKLGAKEEDFPRITDCSLFTQILIKTFCEKDIGRSTILQAAHGKTVLEKDLQPGDLIFLRGTKGHFNDKLYPPEKYGYDFCIGHVVIYTGNGMAIHANGEEGVEKVVEEPLTNIKKSRSKIVIIKRL